MIDRDAGRRASDVSARARRSPSGSSRRSRVIGALGMVLARNAVHSALWLVLTMLCLGVFYVRPGRAVHRHGADHRLHRRDHDAVPVRADAGRPGRLRLADRDAARPAGRRGRCSALGFAGLLGTGALPGAATAIAGGRPGRRPTRTATCRASPRLLFTKYVFAFEVTSALLITAAVGAMMLAHVERRKDETGRPAGDDAGPVRAGQLPGAEARPGRLRHLGLGGDAGPAARRPPAERSISPILPPRELTDAEAAPKRTRREVTSTMTPTYYIVLAAILFTIGAVGVLIRRNAIVLFMCIELMLNAANLALVTFSRINGTLDGQIMAFFVDGRRRGRGRGRPRHHHVDLPDSALGQRRRRQPAEVLRDTMWNCAHAATTRRRRAAGAASGCWSRSRWPARRSCCCSAGGPTAGATGSACASVGAAFVLGLIFFFQLRRPADERGRPS